MKNNGRVSNAIAYVSPSFAGLTVHAMYSNGVDADTNKWYDHYYGLGLAYQLANYRNTLFLKLLITRAVRKKPLTTSILV